MILTKEYITTIIQEYFKDKPVKRVYLFGSYARGDADDNSDVDLFLHLDNEKEKLNYFALAGMWEEFQTKLGKNVDMVHEHKFLKENFLKKIHADKILMFQND